MSVLRILFEGVGLIYGFTVYVLIVSAAALSCKFFSVQPQHFATTSYYKVDRYTHLYSYSAATWT